MTAARNNMKKLRLLSTALLSLLAVIFVACSESVREEPLMPEDPEISNDIIAIAIATDLVIDETPFESRSGNSQDLIGVEITRKTSGSETDAGVPNTIYASGVFDDISDIVFKFVKGGTYSISMCYYPNAKNIVYNYPDGTYGSPFSYIYGLQSYRLNDPVYYGGVEGGWSGDQGPILAQLLGDTYQPGDDRYLQSYKRGTTARYCGKTDYFTVDENTSICVKLELCLMSITLQPTNFTEGELELCFKNYMYQQEGIWTVTPGDVMTKFLQVPYIPGEESLELFYTTPKGEKYLLATKRLQRKHRTNFVFKFDLVERADGTIGIQVPSNESFGDEDSTFDF